MNIKIILIASIFMAIGGWSVRGWYEDSLDKDHLNNAIKQANKLAREDAEIFRDSTEVITVIEKKFIEVEREAVEMSDICVDGGDEFIKLYNSSIKAGNTETGTNSATN